MKHLPIYLILILLVSCSESKDQITDHKKTDSIAKGSKEVTILIKEPSLGGYNELANEDSLALFPISEYNTDLSETPNINRPDKSKIENSKFATNKLFGIWVEDPGPDTPHATFRLDEKSFFVVDYDGDGDMPYLIKGDSITVYYNDFITKGRIIESKKSDELIIHWDDSKRPTIYYTWKN